VAGGGIASWYACGETYISLRVADGAVVAKHMVYIRPDGASKSEYRLHPQSKEHISQCIEPDAVVLDIFV
jgi:hypothetical protein